MGQGTPPVWAQTKSLIDHNLKFGPVFQNSTRRKKHLKFLPELSSLTNTRDVVKDDISESIVIAVENGQLIST